MLNWWLYIFSTVNSELCRLPTEGHSLRSSAISNSIKLLYFILIFDPQQLWASDEVWGTREVRFHPAPYLKSNRLYAGDPYIWHSHSFDQSLFINLRRQEWWNQIYLCNRLHQHYSSIALTTFIPWKKSTISYLANVLVLRSCVLLLKKKLSPHPSSLWTSEQIFVLSSFNFFGFPSNWPSWKGNCIHTLVCTCPQKKCNPSPHLFRS